MTTTTTSKFALTTYSKAGGRVTHSEHDTASAAIQAARSVLAGVTKPTTYTITTKAARPLADGVVARGLTEEMDEREWAQVTEQVRRDAVLFGFAF